MPSASSRVATEKSSRYLQALCGHFSHKTTAEWDANSGVVNFPFGRCEMKAQPEVLLLQVEAEDAEALERAKDVVGGHLERFAVKDGLQVVWSDNVDEDGATAS